MKSRQKKLDIPEILLSLKYYLPLCSVKNRSVKICTKWSPTHIVSQNDIKEVTKEELLEAIRIINKGKSPDIYNLTIEYILYADDSIFSTSY